MLPRAIVAAFISKNEYNKFYRHLKNLIIYSSNLWISLIIISTSSIEELSKKVFVIFSKRQNDKVLTAPNKFCDQNYFINLLYNLIIETFKYISLNCKVMTTQFTKLFSFILASVNDPPPSLQPAYRMQCHSCMSGYLENHFMYISHLYRKPLSFSEKCDRSKFDSNYVQIKNCTDACIMLRMNDKVGGRRRNGYMRGCLSDIIYYNQSAIRGVFDDFGQQNSDSYSNKFLSSIDGINAHNRQKSHSSSSYSSASSCSYIRLRDLFLHSDRYTFEPHDYVKVCTCTHALCNHTRDRSYSIYLFMIAIIITFVS